MAAIGKSMSLWQGCSLANLLHIFRTPFPKNTSERLLLYHQKTEKIFENGEKYIYIEKNEISKLLSNKIINKTCYRNTLTRKVFEEIYFRKISFHGFIF